MGTRAPVGLVVAVLLLATAGCGGSGNTRTPPPAPSVNLSPSTLNFGTHDVGSSTVQPVTLKNTGNAALSITGISTTGDFAQSNSCGASLAAGATCAIQVTFSPTATGTRSGALAVTDNASGSPHSVSLNGAGAAAASTGLPSTFFAITVPTLNNPSSWPVPVPFGTAAKTAGGAYWFNIETSRGIYNWTPLDTILSSAATAGISNVMYTFFDTPQWASSNPTQPCAATERWGVYGCAAPPADIADWNDFVAAVANRYKGRIKYYELWNEADVTNEYSGTIAQMVTLAQNAYSIIKSIDPDAIVMTPSVSLGGVLSSDPNCGSSVCWLARYFAAGGGNYADAVGFHGKACDDATSLCVTYNIACPRDAIQVCAGSPLVNQITAARAVMARYGLSNLPLINTEGGYSQSLATNDLPGASADQQSAYVSRFFIVQAGQGLPIAVWFSWLSNSSLNLTGFGTTSAYAQNNQAYQQTYTWLLGSTMNGPCTQDQNAIWTCALTQPGGHAALIVWSDSASTYGPAQQFTAYRDLAGNRFAIGAGAIPIGIKPILLE